MAHKTEWTRQGCIVNVFGDVNDDELARINAELSGSPELVNLRFFVRDLTNIQSLHMKDDSLAEAAYINASLSQYSPHLRGAFVAAGSVTSEKVRQYIAYAKEAGCRWDQQVFEDREAALRWVGASA